VFLANTVFGVRVATVVQLKIVIVEPDFAQSAKLEVQQRLWPRFGRATPAAPRGGGPMMLITTVFDQQLRRQISFS
jgi:hypothetical protein